MKIGVFGSYNGASIGDHAILEGILTQFRLVIDACQFVVFATDSEATYKLLVSNTGVHVIQGIPVSRSSTVGTSEGEKAKRFQRVKQVLRRRVSRLPLQIADFVRFLYDITRDMVALSKVSFWWQIWKEMRTLDILLIGGGNLLMDLYRRWPIYPLIYTLLAKWAGIPVMFYAVGAGPFQTRLGRFYLRLASQMADILTFRDQDSLEIVAKTLGVQRKKLVLSADPAFCIRWQKHVSHARVNERLRITMTLVSYHRPGYWPRSKVARYKKYREAMIQTIQYILKKMDAELVFFATNTADIVVAKEIATIINIPERIKVIEKRLTVQDILSLVADSQLMIGTRLHSLILSFVVSTPALAFAYQPKVQSLYERVGMETYVINLDHYIDMPLPDNIVHLLRKMFSSKQEIQFNMQQMVKQLQQDAKVSVNLAMQLMEKK